MHRPPGPTSAVVPARDARAAAPRPRAARVGGEEACDEDGLGPSRGLVLAAELSAAFWLGVALLARVLW